MEIMPCELIHNKDIFVREPMDNYAKYLEERYNQKIVLTGGRGLGKSSILYQLENRNIGKPTSYIYTRFEPDILYIQNKNIEILEEDFLIHYYEILFANHILCYIKNYYEITYQKFFIKTHQHVSVLLRQTTDFIKNFLYDPTLLIHKISQKEITGEILETFKKFRKLEGVCLCVDRFDWTNARDALVQKVLSQYFELFDKVILTSDDEKLIDSTLKMSRPYFNHNDFSCMDSSGIHNFESIKMILLKRIDLFNKNPENTPVPIDWLTDDFINVMIDKTKGNLSVMIAVINETLRGYSFYESVTEQRLYNCLNDNIEHVRQLKKMDATPPKFYL